MIKTKASPVSAKEINAAPDKVLGVATVTTASVPGNMAGSGVSSGITALELRNTSNGSTKTTTTAVPQSCTIMPPEGWLQVQSEIQVPSQLALFLDGNFLSSSYAFQIV